MNFASPDAGRNETCDDTGSHLSVVLAYEDFFTGMHALRTFDHLFLSTGCSTMAGRHNVWKFDLLAIAKLRELAVLEAARANMVIISAHGPGDLPPGVRQWIEDWVSIRHDEPGALVMLMDNASPETGKRFVVESYLESCARLAGMDFFNQKTPGRHGGKIPDSTTNTQRDWQAFEILTQVGNLPGSINAGETSLFP